MKARVIAYYLPQFHPIPENDEAWGPGFTEWTNVAKAKPLFRGHYQPRIPSELGFYDLRLPEVREKQAQMAREAGVEGFCYYHYWMGGGRILLQRPFEEVLQSGQPDFPFCLCWANHEWTTKTWENSEKAKVIAPMLYPGDDDYTAHFNYVLPAFRDKRYITIDSRPLFCIFDPYRFKDVAHFIELWQTLAAKAGIPPIHFNAYTNSTPTIRRQSDGSLKRIMPNLESSADAYNELLSMGFDSVASFGRARAEMMAVGKYRRLVNRFLHNHFSKLPALCYDYPKVMPNYFAPEDKWENVFPIVVPQWDRSPRNGTGEGIYINATPEAFAKHLRQAVELVAGKQPEHRILFLKSWNEWGEGNYVEPDLKYGRGFLNAIKDNII
ncbi:MAG: glycoside hydrolase family 99-like domain-containing protein [Prevotella sp.]|nr:glycoside hydrolase family 99-like domain-containing protein [Prevotella sp.]